jgi:hypothetical protein
MSKQGRKARRRLVSGIGGGGASGRLEQGGTPGRLEGHREGATGDPNRKARQTGRWRCLHCTKQWGSMKRALDDWWDHEEGPHLCPGCGSHTDTEPF